MRRRRGVSVELANRAGGSSWVQIRSDRVEPNLYRAAILLGQPNLMSNKMFKFFIQ